MADLSINNKNKIISFYLPQFHTIPENDMAWGRGFTEWTNTKKANPLYNGHYQPKIPLNNNYYDLSDGSVMEWQSALAMSYGIYGFCYYHYWMKNGKKLLEKPIEQMLKNDNVKIPFCLCWANENWTKNWDGEYSNVVVRQEYGLKKDWKKHFYYLLDFFKDSRYITYENKPIFIIYKPEQIAFFDEMIKYWRRLIQREGFSGLIVLRQYPGIISKQIDYGIKFQPAWSSGEYFNYDGSFVKKNPYDYCKEVVKKSAVIFGMEKTLQDFIVKHYSLEKKQKKGYTVISYDETWNDILYTQAFNDYLCNGAFVSWDNTCRNPNGFVYEGSSPDKFGHYMSLLLNKKSA